MERSGDPAREEEDVSLRLEPAVDLVAVALADHDESEGIVVDVIDDPVLAYVGAQEGKETEQGTDAAMGAPKRLYYLRLVKTREPSLCR